MKYDGLLPFLPCSAISSLLPVTQCTAKLTRIGPFCISYLYNHFGVFEYGLCDGQTLEVLFSASFDFVEALFLSILVGRNLVKNKDLVVL